MYQEKMASLGRGPLQEGDTDISYGKVYGQKSVAISVIEIKRGSFRLCKTIVFACGHKLQIVEERQRDIEFLRL
jgi:hypothetical protein